MNIKRLLIATVLIVSVAAPLAAESNWVDSFLKRYQPSEDAANSTEPSEMTPIGEMLQTGTIPIGLSDLVNLMLDHNLDIRSNRFSPRSSYYSSLVFYRALQPNLRFSMNQSKDTNASTTQLNGASNAIQRRRNLSAGFTQNLAYGTSFSIDLTMNRLESNSVNNIFNPSSTGRVTYTIGQKLLRDRGRLPNTRQIQQGENNQKISEINFEIQITNLIVQAQKAYWDLVFTGEDLKVKQRSLELAQRTLDENQMKVDIGTLAPIELTLNRSDVANRRDAMLTSTFSVTTAEDQIKKLVSSERDPSMFLMKFAAKDTPRNPTGITVPILEEAVRTALENRPELRSSALDLKNKQIDEKYTANQKLPQLDVTMTYNQNGTGGTRTGRGGTIGENSGNIAGTTLNPWGQLFGYDFTGYSFGFSLVIPISNRAGVADHDRAVTERQLAEARMNATAQAIMLEVRNALTQVEQNRARIETAQTALDLARQRLDAEQTKFNLGTSTLRFVLEEQRNVAQAETNELQTRVNLTKALIDLDKAMGMTLRSNNIEIERALQSPAIADYKVIGSPSPAANQR